MRAPLVLRLYQ